MTELDPTIYVNIFASKRLIKRFCQGECMLKGECQPNILADETPLLGEPNQLVVGLIAQSLCPIANRTYPKQGWFPGPFGCER